MQDAAATGEGLTHVHVRKWRKELKHVGPGGHLEVLAWIPVVPTPTPALQSSLQHNVDTAGKSSAVVKKAQFNTRKRTAPIDGAAARMTRSLRHNTPSGSELWGQLPSNSVRPPVRKEEKKAGDDDNPSDAASGRPASNDTASEPQGSIEHVSDPSPAPTEEGVVKHEYSFADDDDDDDEGYISPLSSPDVASPSPVASPDTS
ncbi:hypothetical protein DYB37_004780 [Aphanomyces astaci]|uniref:Uncharacterized protein n=1 Tax=Aphanomyces astaci TaxID=112090 RepID=A0A397BNA1_APHAT|nr:hypothetical protein AaE_009039 [Aphanomyces astaci]RHY21009.1 hypothetical protein DYB36_011252 [Aphanomyces astaci]RHZ17634.1 hypothetical protein DYB37_004780 [Aphanomyces astaci]